MKAKDIHVGNTFPYKSKFLTRVLFEGETEILYRCIMNIATITDENEIMFIPLNEDIGLHS